LTRERLAQLLPGDLPAPQRLDVDPQQRQVPRIHRRPRPHPTRGLLRLLLGGEDPRFTRHRRSQGHTDAVDRIRGPVGTGIPSIRIAPLGVGRAWLDAAVGTAAAVAGGVAGFAAVVGVGGCTVVGVGWLRVIGGQRALAV
jgi:hypothetical protein